MLMKSLLSNHKNTSFAALKTKSGDFFATQISLLFRSFDMTQKFCFPNILKIMRFFKNTGFLGTEGPEGNSTPKVK